MSPTPTNPTLSADEVARLGELLERATNVGQWQIGRLGIEPRPHVVDFGPPPGSPFFALSKATPAAPGFTGLSAGGSVHSDDDSSADNAALIVAAVNTLPRLLAERDACEVRIATLFDAIQHGDDEHRAWLREAIGAHFAGRPVPEPRGGGRKDAQPIETAPKDGAMLWLLVSYEERHSIEDGADHPLADAVTAWTIGFNNFDHDGEDEWKFAGWCWSHDHFTEGRGKVLAWKPIGFEIGADDDPAAAALLAGGRG